MSGANVQGNGAGAGGKPSWLARVGAAADELLDKTILFSYSNIGYALRRPWWETVDANLAGKVCVVSGANAGLGKEVSLALARRGATVHMLCRNAERGAAAQSEIVRRSGNTHVRLHLVDLSLQQSLRAFAQTFAPERADVLVNNASVLLPQRQESAEGIELTFATNVIGYLLLTELLLPRLRRAGAARVINVTSGGMYAARLHPEDLEYERRPYDGARAYAETKRAEVIMTERWANAWGGNGIAVHSVHPGWADTPGVASSLPRFHRIMRPLLRTPGQGADTIVWLCALPDLHEQPNGQLWFDRRIRPRHRFGANRNNAAEVERFWRTCYELAGLEPAA